MTNPNKSPMFQEAMLHERHNHAEALAELTMPDGILAEPGPATTPTESANTTPDADNPAFRRDTSIPTSNEEETAAARKHATTRASWDLADRQLEARAEGRKSAPDSVTRWTLDNLSDEEKRLRDP